MEGGTSFTFVTDGIESALKQAFAAAKGKDVRLGRRRGHGAPVPEGGPDRRTASGAGAPLDGPRRAHLRRTWAAWKASTNASNSRLPRRCPTSASSRKPSRSPARERPWIQGPLLFIPFSILINGHTKLTIVAKKYFERYGERDEQKSIFVRLVAFIAVELHGPVLRPVDLYRTPDRFFVWLEMGDVDGLAIDNKQLIYRVIIYLMMTSGPRGYQGLRGIRP